MKIDKGRKLVRRSGVRADRPASGDRDVSRRWSGV